jgi:hypothetical protein
LSAVASEYKQKNEVMKYQSLQMNQDLRRMGVNGSNNNALKAASFLQHYEDASNLNKDNSLPSLPQI